MNETTKTQIEQAYGAGKKFLRPKEVALRCGIGLSTVFHYARQGKLTAKKISKRVTVFSIDDVEKLFDAAVEVS